MHTPLTEPHASESAASRRDSGGTHPQANDRQEHGKVAIIVFCAAKNTKQKKKQRRTNQKDLSKQLLAFAEDCSRFPGIKAKKWSG
ncbi:MAG: hypothetical protein J6V77_03110 [Clostridia bacterium]|nr:hypothetical protein [Clostridia bacterium]